MVDLCPIAFVMKYWQVLDFCFFDFFKEIELFFEKDPETGFYICSEKVSERKLKKYFKEKIKRFLINQKESVCNSQQFSSYNTKKFFVIDGCSSIQNHFLFNGKNKLFENRFECIENDIRFDFKLLEEIWEKLFIEFFKKGHEDWFFLKANDVTTTELLNIMQTVFGKKHCIDILKNHKSKILVDKTESCFDRKDDKQLSKMKIDEISDFVKAKYI